MSRLTFFRQSGWMLIATVVGGGFMWAVHVVAPARLDQGAYGLFNTLLPLLGFIGIPAVGVQAILAQQTAAATSDLHLRQLRGAIRFMLGGTFIIWVAAMIAAFFLRDYLMGALKIKEPAALWITLLTGLLILWTPVFGGVLQGRQNFLWLGWTAILGGAGRFIGIVILVYLLAFGITGAMTAVLVGILAALVISAWQTQAVWRGPTEPFIGRAWLARVVPLSLGIGATTFIMNADMIFVRRFFGETETDFYSAAGILGRALAYFTAPMTQVMFPKVVHSATRAERTDVVAQAVGATALLGGLGALLCTIAPSLPLRIVYPETYLVITPLVPWFAWCILPLTLSNVLINNLLARTRFAVVPWLVLVALSYGGVLFVVCKRIASADELAAFKTVVRILGLFGLLALIVSAWFTWRTTEHGRPPRASTAAGAT
jgi:O-antigen/teichoic acid export membrane protein